MCFSKTFFFLVAFLACVPCVGQASGTPKAIREELKEILAEQGLSEGINRQSQSIVGIGISWSEREPELVARAMAAGRISCLLNRDKLSVTRKAIEDSKGSKVTSVIKKITEGYVTGVREVARVTRRDDKGRLAVGIALRWTLAQEIEAAKAVSVLRGEENDLAKGLRTIEHIHKMAGPQFWIDDAVKRSCLLGIGVAEIKEEKKNADLTAVRLAQIKARRYLSFHFCQYDRDVDILKQEFREDAPSLSSELNSLHIVKSRGVIASGLGVADVYERIVKEDGHRYAVCVACVISEN